MWPKLFNSLRGSCETELLESHPNFLVAEWLGHSVEIQEAHYAKVRPEDYLRAAGVQTAHGTAQTVPAPDAPSSPGIAEKPMVDGEDAISLSSPRPLKAEEVSPGGFEPPTFGFGSRRSIQLRYGDLTLSEVSVNGTL